MSLRLFFSLKYITANVVDRNNGRIIATASSVEHDLKRSFECGRTSNAKAAAVVGEVLSMRLKVLGFSVGEHRQGQGQGQGQGADAGSAAAIHADVGKEIEKKGFKNSTKVWAVVNALKDNGVRLVLDDRDDPPPYSLGRFR